MNKIFRGLVILGFCFGIFSCAPSRPLHKPPPPIREIRSTRPGPKYIWVQGHHVWRGKQWRWVKGHWVKRKPGKAWIQGHWIKRGRHWVWIKGHWR